MKSHFSHQLSAITVLMALFGIFFCIATQEKADGATLFDSPFPSSAYKRVLDTVMLVWEDVRLFNSGKSGLDAQACQDLIVGRLVRLNGYCDILLKKRHKAPTLQEDKEYLVQILRTVINEYKGGNSIIKQLLNQIAIKISKLGV